MAIVFVFTRALVGIVAMSEDLAKNSGMLYTLFLVQTSLLQLLFVLYGLLLVFL